MWTPNKGHYSMSYGPLAHILLPHLKEKWESFWDSCFILLQNFHKQSWANLALGINHLTTNKRKKPVVQAGLLFFICFGVTTLFKNIFPRTRQSIIVTSEIRYAVNHWSSPGRLLVLEEATAMMDLVILTEHSKSPCQGCKNLWPVQTALRSTCISFKSEDNQFDKSQANPRIWAKMAD